MPLYILYYYLETQIQDIHRPHGCLKFRCLCMLKGLFIKQWCWRHVRELLSSRYSVIVLSLFLSAALPLPSPFTKPFPCLPQCFVSLTFFSKYLFVCLFFLALLLYFLYVCLSAFRGDCLELKVSGFSNLEKCSLHVYLFLTEKPKV